MLITVEILVFLLESNQSFNINFTFTAVTVVTRHYCFLWSDLTYITSLVLLPA